jgi:uncharacterized membrane protein YtjA (UPF0391 family)
MPIYPLAILIGAVVSGLLGFSGVADASPSVARILFLVFTLLFFTLLILRRRRGF